MKHSLTVIEGHRFDERDFIGGDAALDFVNTVAGRDQSPRDRLDSYARLLEWAAESNILPGKVLKTLARIARDEPAAAVRALARAKTLREALFSLITALAAGKSPPEAALALLRLHWILGVEAHELRFSAGRVAPELDGAAADLDLVAVMVAYRMVAFVLTQPTGRLRICAGNDCAWLFIDRSKAGRRRWCDMAVCGNAAKSRRFHAKERAKA